MVHPADACSEELCAGPAAAGMRLRRRVFPQSLERGVILRVRARGLFLPAGVDPAVLESCHAAFVSQRGCG
jgi:hypothetical protein